MARCNDCYGVKSYFPGIEQGDGKCSACYGTGKEQGWMTHVINELNDAIGGEDEKCSTCSGTKQCQTCGGTGEVEE